MKMLQEHKFGGESCIKKNTEELSKMFKYRDKTTKHDLNWNKELRESCSSYDFKEEILQFTLL
jgi:hypothetical protein